MAFLRASTIQIAAIGVAALGGGCNLVIGLTSVPQEVDASLVQTARTPDASLPEGSAVAALDAGDSASTDGGIESDVGTEGEGGADGETSGPDACAELAGYCTNHCDIVYDNCGAAVSCPGCEAGVTCTAGSCGCDPDPATTTCMGKNCGIATNNCGQLVACGANGTPSCAAGGDVCQTGGTCCTPDNAAACAGKCGATVTNNCGQSVACSSACADGGVCTSNESCCAPVSPSTWCANRCGSVTDNCGQAITCPGCDHGLTCTSGSCGCVPDPVSTTCTGKSCGTATNNCGQMVSCGANGTVNCASATDVCNGNACCTPDNATACAGKCNTTVTNNCGQSVTCSATCPNAGVCLSNLSCCTPNNTSACSGLACGPATNNCGQNVPCPNTCVSPNTCGGGGAGANACGCTATGNPCASLACGPATNSCGVPIACPNTCGAGSACSGNRCLLNNGQSCGQGSDCLSGVCTTFYLDGDQDGHGWAGSPKSVCGTTPPAGYVQSSDDCCDQDANTFPGQTEWFTAPSTGCVGPPIDHDGWDFNCSGQDEQEWTEISFGNCVPSNQNCAQVACTCPTDFMWYGSGPVPACGVGASQMQCSAPPFSSPGGWFCSEAVNGQGQQQWSATQGCH